MSKNQIFDVYKTYVKSVIHLVRAQNFPKN